MASDGGDQPVNETPAGVVVVSMVGQQACRFLGAGPARPARRKMGDSRIQGRLFADKAASAPPSDDIDMGVGERPSASDRSCAEGRKSHQPRLLEPRDQRAQLHPVVGGVGFVPGLVLDSSPLKSRIRVLNDGPKLPDFHVGFCTSKRNLEGSPLVRAFWSSI